MTETADCVFCKIVAGEMTATTVSETERTLGFRDINPQAPTHVLIIPKTHYATAADTAAADNGLLDELVSQAHRIAEEDGIADAGYRLVLNTGTEAGQTVHHVHCHLIGGRPLSWPPG